MTQADSVLSTPPINTSALPEGNQPPEVTQDALFLPTDATPEEIFQAIGRLRKEARDAIHELIQLLDRTDDYVSHELEDDGDQGDASYPEGTRMCTNPMEDDEEDDPGEDAGNDEPSLGSLNDYHGKGTNYAGQSVSLVDAEGCS